MTDAELSKAVADACGIEVFLRVLGVGRHEWRRYTGEGTYSDVFDPPNDWSAAMHAAERFGLFDKHDAAIEKNRATGRWVVSFYADANTKHVDGVNNESGPRAICEAILAIKKGTT